VRIDKNRRNILIYHITLTQKLQDILSEHHAGKLGKKGEMGEIAYKEYTIKKTEKVGKKEK
jgi:hypothetical protein